MLWEVTAHVWMCGDQYAPRRTCTAQYTDTCVTACTMHQTIRSGRIPVEVSAGGGGALCDGGLSSWECGKAAEGMLPASQQVGLRLAASGPPTVPRSPHRRSFTRRPHSCTVTSQTLSSAMVHTRSKGGRACRGPVLHMHPTTCDVAMVWGQPRSKLCVEHDRHQMPTLHAPARSRQGLRTSAAVACGLCCPHFQQHH